MPYLINSLLKSRSIFSGQSRKFRHLCEGRKSFCGVFLFYVLIVWVFAEQLCNPVISNIQRIICTKFIFQITINYNSLQQPIICTVQHYKKRYNNLFLQIFGCNLNVIVILKTPWGVGTSQPSLVIVWFLFNQALLLNDFLFNQSFVT